jgi:uncharacterized protein DUF3306
MLERSIARTAGILALSGFVMLGAAGTAVAGDPPAAVAALSPQGTAQPLVAPVGSVTVDPPASERSAFLAAGAPPALPRAASRRTWSADPAIRDFIGLSESSWDFTAPDGVPGFGVVTAEDARRLMAQFPSR